MKFKKTEHHDWLLDEESNVLINNNINELEEYRLKVQQVKEMNELRNELKDYRQMKIELSELKKQFQELLGK